MDSENIVTFQLQLTRRKVLLLLTAFFICWHPGFLGSETLTLTTYYPAPFGGYVSLLTTGRTLLARDGGNVGIGTPTPNFKLHVNAGGIGGAFGMIPSYTAWATYGTGDGGAAIYNDAGAYQGLMLVGNSSGGGVRRVKVWDEFTVNGNTIIAGNLSVSGTITGMCRVVGYSINVGGPGQSCSGTEQVITWRGNGAAVSGMMFLGGALENPAAWTPYVSVGADRAGQLLCCRIQ